MATIAQVMTAIADQIRDVLDDVTDVAVQVEDIMVTNPSPPTIDFWIPDQTNDPELAAFGEQVGGDLFHVRARVSLADSRAGQELLLAFMDDEDPLSILLAINEDLTLGGLAATTDVRTRSGYTIFPTAGGGDLLGCTWGLVVVKART